MSTQQENPDASPNLTSSNNIDNDFQKLEALQPKPWIVDQDARMIIATSSSLAPKHQARIDDSEFKTPHIFNDQVCSRYIDIEKDAEPLLGQFENGKSGVRLSSHLLGLTATEDPRMALQLSDPPLTSVWIIIKKYDGQRANEAGGLTTASCSSGVTVGQVLAEVRSLSSMYATSARPEGMGRALEICVNQENAIWVTAEEQAKVEKEGKVFVSKTKEGKSSGWLVLTEEPKK